MKRSSVLVVLHPSLMPPDTLEGQDPKAIAEWRTEYDVIQTLRANGHEVRALGVLDSITELRTTIADWQPDVVFNLLEEFDGIVSYDQHVIAFLEMLRQPYTGCNPRGLLLSRDKALCKQVFAFHRIPSPQFQVFPRGLRVKLPRKLRFPLFVKSSTDDASLGIAQASVVDDPARLRERIEFVIEQHKSDVLVEEYIEGRELYVGMMGNQRRHRHAQGEVGPEVPRQVRHRQPARHRPASGHRGKARPPLPAHLPRAGAHRLRPHGFPHAGRWQPLRARGQCQSASGAGRRLRALGGRCRTQLW